VRTHYDNLKIAENAPNEVVKAAYRALSQRYHPDKNPGNKDAVRIMQILNEAYETLSNPLRRKEYDDLLAIARQPKPNPQTSAFSNPPPLPRQPSAPRRRSLLEILRSIFFWNIPVSIFALAMVFGNIGRLFEKGNPSKGRSRNSSSYNSSPPAFIRPTTAPNGQPWPLIAGYIPKWPILAQGGLSSVTIDNTRNSSDVFLKLVLRHDTIVFPVRLCFIPAYSQFKFESVKPGRYDVRYQDLSSGGYSKTEDFILNEIKTFQGTEFSNLSLTLYKVNDGNMHTQTINESDF
jgi:curved DNA-binding protein CbpA